QTTVAYTGATTTEYKAPHRYDLQFHLTGSTDATRFALEEYSDWSFTGRWLGGSASPTATLAQGSPFVWLEDVDFRQLRITTIAGSSIEVEGNQAFVTTDGRTSLVLAPEGSQLDVQDGELFVTDLTTGNLAVGLLPDTTPETRTHFVAVAASRPTATHFRWDTVSDPYAIRLQFDFQSSNTSSAETIVAVYPHLSRLAGDSSLLGTPITSSTYVSPRGAMEVISTSGFEVQIPNRGVMPTLPAVLTVSQQETLRELVKNDPAAIDPTGTLSRYGDTYWAGKAMLKLSQLAQLADITAQPDVRDRILHALKEELNDWFTATGTPGDKHFAYNAQWDTLQGYPDSFGSAGDLNDHHFHYGYFIHAAALVGGFDPVWAQSQRTMIDLLVADVAGTDTAGNMLPRLRNFSPMAGHSWASGHGAFGSGNNHESSSEAMNFATAVILWGEVTQDPGMTGLGQMLYSVEAEAISEYWFNRYGNAFPADFPHESLGMVWGDGGSHATWFSAEPEMIKGINLLPFHGGSLYLSEMARDSAALLAEISELGGGVINDWPGIILQYEALVDPQRAVERLAQGDMSTEAGQSAAQTYFWTHVLANIGSPTSTIRGDHALSAVFQSHETTTYSAHNSGTDSITVHFNDGTSFEVAGRTTAVWQRVPGASDLTDPRHVVQPSAPPPIAPTPAPVFEPVATTTSIQLLLDMTTGVAFIQEENNEPIPIQRNDDYWQGNVLLTRGTATLIGAARDDLGQLRVLDVSEWGYFTWILDENGVFIGEEGPQESSLHDREHLFQLDLDKDGLIGHNTSGEDVA
ncbi:MAG: glycosyl hydrolase, partial [Pirellulales bacterium]